MTFASTAISFILIASGLATCGWQFFTALRAGPKADEERSIGRLLTTLFFVAAAYNTAVGIGPLLSLSNPTHALWISITSHILLTTLAAFSVYTAYFIFCPPTPPRLLLLSIGVLGGAGLFHINNPVQLAPLLIGGNSPNILIVTGSLLVVSLTAILFIFIQLFRKSADRSTRMLSAAICGLTIATAANTVATIGTHTPNEVTLVISLLSGLTGFVFLLSGTSSRPLRLTITLLVILLLAWIVLTYSNIFTGAESTSLAKEIWSLSMQIVSFMGLWIAFARKQQTFRGQKEIKRSILFLSLGLGLQILAHNLYYYYVFILQRETPYPSPIDIGYIGSAGLYLFGSFSIVKSLLGGFKVISKIHRAIGIIVFLAGILVAYPPLMNEPSSTMLHPTRILLDIGYPLLESAFVALALIVILNTKKIASRQIRGFVFCTFFALLSQYLADFSYTYLLDSGSWPDGRINDIFYLASYFLMSTAIIKFHNTQRISRLPCSKNDTANSPFLLPAASAVPFGKSGSYSGIISELSGKKRSNTLSLEKIIKITARPLK